MNQATIDFLNAHLHDDPVCLLLHRDAFPEVDMPWVAQQLEGRQQASAKWPSLSLCPDFWFPPRLNRQQSSSDTTALYKAVHFVSGSDSVADITGGMGIDTLAFARAAAHVDYVERDPCLAASMRHNCTALHLSNVSCHCADSIQWLAQHPAHYDLLFVDPARRDTAGHKVVAFDQCSPNILQHWPALLAAASRVLVKASPMIDLSLACRQLAAVSDIHIVAVNGECKEVLFDCHASSASASDPCIHCVDGDDIFSFSRSADAALSPVFATHVARYLYEPNAALMKGAPFALIGQRFGLGLLDRNTHLYTSDHLVSFPGRIFEVLQPVRLNKKSLAPLLPQHKAHVICRNFPLSAPLLQRQLGLSEGGSLSIVALSLGSHKLGFLCRQL